jgi:predicted GNAT family acetyltransferase
MSEQDLNFVLSSWLQSYKTSEFAAAIPHQLYYRHHQELIKQILLHENNHVTILCPIDDPEQILGFIAYNTKQPIIYYVYMKQVFRKLGLASYLVSNVLQHLRPEPSSTAMVTHKPKRWSTVARKWNLVYCPYVSGA